MTTFAPMERKIWIITARSRLTGVREQICTPKTRQQAEKLLAMVKKEARRNSCRAYYRYRLEYQLGVQLTLNFE